MMMDSPMTERDWLTSTFPEPMLIYLRGRGSERKFRLLACACCRRIHYLLVDPRSRAVVDEADSWADHPVPSSITATVRQFWEYRRTLAPHTPIHDAAWTAGAVAGAYAWAAAWNVVSDVRRAISFSNPGNAVLEGCEQGRLLREIFGNPFRPVTIEESWLSWNDRIVSRLAQVIYDERRFQDMPILADAIEEAGCTNGALLEHCRSEALHVRGCWVIDLLLKKE